MNFPGSSSSNSPNSLVPVTNCQVCGQQGHGKHFGAFTCRACAAFFRRCGTSNNFKPCKKGTNCDFLKNGWFNCKACRLQRCKDIGMTGENFQFGRDSFYPRKAREAIQKFCNQIPQTMGTFLGRSNLILFRAPEFHNDSKCYIDLNLLMNTAAEMLKTGCEIPIRAPNTLEKLALGLQAVRGYHKKEVKLVFKFGRNEAIAAWQHEMLKVAKWLTYFDEFQKLPHSIQVDLMSGIWKVWNRLENLAVTALGRRQKICHEKMIMAYVENDKVICDLLKVEIDLTWCSRFTLDELRFFADHDISERAEDVTQAMMDLQPTDVELSYMLCQLCFHHVEKRYHGEILKVAERFQETLSNDLHDYYVNRMNKPQYSTRVAQMMKINNHIRKDIYRGRVKSELAKVFDVFFVEFSHPELFVDNL